MTNHGTSTNHLTGCYTLLTDSIKGIQKGIAAYPDGQATVASFAPLLSYGGQDIINFGEVCTGPRLHDIAERLADCALELFLDEEFGTREERLLGAMTLVRGQRELVKLMALDWSAAGGPFIVVDVDAGWPALSARLNGDWQSILPKGAIAAELQVPDLDIDTDVLAQGHKTAGFWQRLAFEPLSSVGYRLFRRGEHWRSKLPSKGDVYILSENGLQKDTAFHLAMSGYRLKSMPAINLQVDAALPFQSTHETIFSRSISKLKRTLMMSDEAEGSFRKVITERFAKELTTLTLSETKFEGWINRLARRPIACLGNAKVSSMGLGLHRALKKQSIPLIGFQHAVTVELHAAHRHVAVEWDNVGNDLVFVYNDRAVELLTLNPFGGGKVVSVGAARELRRVVRKSARVNGPAIFYVSTALYTGHWQMAAMKGVPDSEKAEREIALIRDVFRKMPHRMLYKPYPALRYIDPDPVIREARLYGNIEIHKGNEDLRYLMQSARLLITSRATSTLSWCLMSGRPVIYIDHPYDLPLEADVRSALNEAVFVFDSRDPDYAAKILDLLELPLYQIEELAKEKQDARKRFLRKFIDTDLGVAGSIAANYLECELFPVAQA